MSLHSHGLEQGYYHRTTQANNLFMSKCLLNCQFMKLLTRCKFYVTGYILNLVLAESFESVIQPLNSSVIFVKESDIILTNDAWHIAIDVNISTNNEAISIVRADLLLVEHCKQEYTPTSELQHVGPLLQQLESKPNDYSRYYRDLTVGVL
jgi:hypothetical protein